MDKAVARKHGRHRKSQFRETGTGASFNAQKEFPKEVSRAFSAYSLVYGVALLAMAVLHVVTKPHGCDEKTWEKVCVNKISFCKSKISPSCDCAALFIVNDFNLTALPNNMVDVPPRMEQLTKMVGSFRRGRSEMEKFEHIAFKP